MLKKTIKYTDFNGVEQEEEYHFHLSKAALIAHGLDSGFETRIKRMMATSDGVAIMGEITWFIEQSIGRKSEDGKLFIQDQAARDRLRYSPAWDELIVELLGVENALLEFIRGIMPKEMAVELKNKFEELQGKSSTTMPVEEDTRPAWIREDREPTEKELATMPKNELVEAFRRKLEQKA